LDSRVDKIVMRINGEKILHESLVNIPKLLTTNQGGGELLLCLDVDCDPGFEVDGIIIG